MPEITEDIDKFISSSKATAVKAPYPKVGQRDNDCGIFALGAGLNYYNEKKTGKPFAFPARANNANKISPKNDGAVTPIEGASSLRELAKKKGYTVVGELFDAQYVEELAKLTGNTDAKRHAISDDKGLLKIVQDAVGKNRTVMVPYSNQGGDPGTVGTGAHWALVFGYFNDGAADWVIATHWNKYWKWGVKELWASNDSIKDWPKTTYVKNGASDWNPLVGNTKTYTETREIPEAKLSSTLRHFVVEI
jgi:hypothetical protein